MALNTTFCQSADDTVKRDKYIAQWALGLVTLVVMYGLHLLVSGVLYWSSGILLFGGWLALNRRITTRRK